MVTDKQFQDLKKQVDSDRLCLGIGYDLKRTAAGTTLRIKRPQHSTDPYPFKMQMVSDELGDPKIRVYASILGDGSSTDLGFAEGDDPPYLLTPSAGVLQGGITINVYGGITSRWLEIVEELSTDTEDTFYVEIGTIAYDTEAETYSVTNTSYGPLYCTICRNWFSNPAEYTVAWNTLIPSY